MSRARTLMLTVALLWGMAGANAPTSSPTLVATLPADADLMITEARGVIVGVGRIVEGTSFELALLAGFEGPGLLTVLLGDGSTSTLQVVVAAGVVWIGDVDLLELLPATVERVAVRFDRVPGAPRGPAFEVPGVGGGPPAEPPAWGRPDEPPAGPPADPPGPPDGVPAGEPKDKDKDEDAERNAVDLREPPGRERP